MDITTEEETKAKEFLKRAEIKTMKKDLQKLREVDALIERDKIIKGKSVQEEQAIIKELADKKEKQEKEQEREKVLSKAVTEERTAEKQIKDYANETEKQQIFLFESQRLGLEKQIDILEKEKEPALSLEENRALLQRREWEAKLSVIIADEKKIEAEQKFLEEKENASNVPAEKKSFEESRGDLEVKRQEIEKKRWAIEKELKKVEDSLTIVNTENEKITLEKNVLREKISSIDKSLREIYSGIVSRVEDEKKGKLQEQQVSAEKLAKKSQEEKDSVQRQQWTNPNQVPKEKEFLRGVSEKAKEKISNSLQAEEEQRRKFLEDIEKQVQEEQTKKDNKT